MNIVLAMVAQSAVSALSDTLPDAVFSNSHHKVLLEERLRRQILDSDLSVKPLQINFELSRLGHEILPYRMAKI